MAYESESKGGNKRYLKILINILRSISDTAVMFFF